MSNVGDQILDKELTKRQKPFVKSLIKDGGCKLAARPSQPEQDQSLNNDPNACVIDEPVASPAEAFSAPRTVKLESMDLKKFKLSDATKMRLNTANYLRRGRTLGNKRGKLQN